ncbi:MAG: hypothetical protein LBT67_02085 [Holosporaceae bacterium]|jgi:hypothetical protein|nr:hypothetical protein [Holosporaceae bacterium]
MGASNFSKKFLLICSVASILLCDDACALEKRIAGGPEVEVNVEAKIVAAIDVEITGRTKKVELLGEDGDPSETCNRIIYVKYHRPFRGSVEIDSTFEAEGSDDYNPDIVTFWVDFYPVYDERLIISLCKDTRESPVYDFVAEQESCFFFKIESEYKEKYADTYTGSVKITLVPAE